MSQGSLTFINATPVTMEANQQYPVMPFLPTTLQPPVPLPSYPQSLPIQQQYAMPGRVNYPPMQHAVMAGNAPKIQGVYSTYSARLKQSNDHALLLPASYLTTKKPQFVSESDDDFEEYAEDYNDRETPSSGVQTRSASTTAVNTVQNTLPASQLQGTLALHKTARRRNHMYPSESDLERASRMEEVLVPIRLDIDMDDVKLRDAFLWNMNEQFLTPEKFAETLCEDLALPTHKFVPRIADAIRTQVADFEAIHEVELPSDQIRVVVNLDLQIGKINLRDRFEWDLGNTASNAPEVFSRQLASELGLGGEYVGIITHAIREQLYQHKRQWVDERLDDIVAEPVTRAFRGLEDAEAWTPQMEMLSNEELEKLLIAQERNMRRLRRETRFKRSRRRLSVTPTRHTAS